MPTRVKPTGLVASGDLILALSISIAVSTAGAQDLVAVDDGYAVPYGMALAVQAFGVLENDVLYGEAAGEMGATAQLVTDASFGTLSLSADGSFTYSPGAGFDGADQFVYRALFDTLSSEATVSLSACAGGPDVYTCWNETEYLALAARFGLFSFQEGFEDDAAWGGARSPATSPAVVSQGVRWTSNHPDPPASNEITTGPGPARTGQWAIFDMEHGYATGTVGECDVDIPPAHCLYHDGFTGVREPGLNPLHGVGGYITGIFGAKVGILIDGAAPIGGGQITGSHQFFGVIDNRPAGFTQFEFRELEGKIGNALFVFADDFTCLTRTPTAVTGTGPAATKPAIRIAGANPTRAGTTLQFNLGARSDVTLAIYSATGRLVREMARGSRRAGIHTIDWDGRNGAGRAVPAGIYFARLVVAGAAGRDVRVGKIAIVR